VGIFLDERFRKGRVKLQKDGKPYIKKIAQILEINVWLVNGEFIRKNISEDFVNYDHHYHLGFIPRNEFWIAKGASTGEMKCYMDRMLTEYMLMKNGVSYEEASEKAASIERIERGKSRIIRKLRGGKNNKKHLIRIIHRKLMKKFSNGVSVWLVNGELVRDLFFVDFGGGGHDKVYYFVPRGEVWIDDEIPPGDRAFIMLHELRERNLMAGGMEYPEAHRKATELEHYIRNHPKCLEIAIGKETGSETLS